MNRIIKTVKFIFMVIVLCLPVYGAWQLGISISDGTSKREYIDSLKTEKLRLEIEKLKNE